MVIFREKFAFSQKNSKDNLAVYITCTIVWVGGKIG
jgi:hypothetical protein